MSDAALPGVAIVGCGLVGRKRASAVVGLGGRVVALHDADRARAQALADELPPGVTVADAPEAAFGHADAGLAIVATPHDQLTMLGAKAVSSGCHLLLEKPGARCAAELAALASEAESSHRVVRVGYNHRFHPAILEARHHVRSGAHGEVISVRGRYGHGGRLGYEAEWRADATRSGGGELLDQAVHLIDLVRFLVGDVSLAFAELRAAFWATEVEDNAFVALRAESGAFAWLHSSWTEWKNLFALEIALRSARLDVSGLGGSYGTERLTTHEMLPEMGPPKTREQEWDEPDRSWQRELADFAAALAGEPAIGCDLADALAVLRIVDEVYGR